MGGDIGKAGFRSRLNVIFVTPFRPAKNHIFQKSLYGLEIEEDYCYPFEIREILVKSQYGKEKIAVVPSGSTPLY